MNKKSKRRIVLIVIGCIVVLITGFGGLVSANLYDNNINKRFESYPPLKLRVDDFDNLKYQKYTFPSDKGQLLTGYLYHSDGEQRGIIVFAHGFGGGHNSYLDCIHYFAKNGYYVFAYDATGNDESEGNGVGGFPQGAIDLNYAISFVQNKDEFPDLPIALFGHSWGGYGVCSVLTYHPEVKAVISSCGCNRSSDLFESGGRSEAGNVIYAMMPFVKIHEWIKYGKYATNTAIDGFEASKAAVMIAHSLDDDVILPQYGYNQYYARYQNNPRFSFLLFDDKGHSDFFLDKNNSYKQEFGAKLEQWMQGLPYDRLSEEGKERFATEKADFIQKNLDRSKWSGRLDEKLFEQFLRFYDENIG